MEKVLDEDKQEKVIVVTKLSDIVNDVDIVEIDDEVEVYEKIYLDISIVV